MEAVTLFFASGFSFFVGIGLIIFFCLLILLRASPLLVMAGRLLAMVGYLFLALSSVPRPWWEYLILLVAGAVVFFANWEESRRGVLRWAGLVVCLLMAGWMFAREWKAQQPPSHGFAPVQRVLVLGNSITATSVDGAPRWPQIISQQNGIPVIDLSEPGLKMEGALRKLGWDAPRGLKNTVIILQVGAKDFAASTPASEYRFYLEEILKLARQQGNFVVIVASPLPPFFNHIAAIQRELADQYGAVLLPRRFFSGVLGHPGASRGGLELTAVGHELFADMLREHVVGAGTLARRPEEEEEQEADSGAAENE